MNAAEIKAQLQRIKPFVEPGDSASQSIINTLLRISEQAEWDDGHEFITEGQTADDRGYVLLDGTVRVAKSSGKELQVAAPAILGEMKQHSHDGKRGATVVTAGPCTLLVFEWKSLHTALGRELAAGDWSAFRIALERYSWDYLLGEGL